MNWKRNISLFLGASMLLGILCSCAGDPRKNCNHPQHGAYMKEQRMKKTGF